MVTITRIGVVFLSILFNIDLIFAHLIQNICTPSITHEDDVFNHSLLKVAIPINYTIILKPDNDKVFYGTISIRILVLEETSTIAFHSKNLEIDYGSLRFGQERTNGIKYKLNQYNYCPKTQISSLLFETTLFFGFYILSMNYTGVIAEDLGFVQIRRNESKIGFITSYITMLEPNGARRVFPCWDDPRFKASYTISVDHSPEYHVFSNTRKYAVTQLKEDLVRTSFETTLVMSSYLVTIGILHSMYRNVTEDRIWFSTQVPKTSSVLLQNAIKWTDSYLMMHVISDYLWTLTVNVIVFPELPSKVIGAWECVVFRKSDIVCNELDFHDCSWNIQKVVIQGLTQKYIESLVSPTKMSDLWLHKIFGLHISYDIIKKYFINAKWMIYLHTVQILQSAMHNDDVCDVPPIAHEYDPIYSSLIQKKASAIINMLENIVTRDVLMRAILEYLYKHMYSHATPINFLNNINTVLVNIKSHFQNNITKVMSSWLSHKKYPILLVTRDYDTNSTMISCNNTYCEHADWVIPIIYTTQRYNYVFDNPILWSSNPSSQYYNSTDFPQIDKDEWILVNKERFGYYRVNYDNENWLKIARFLIRDHKKISVLTRAQILDDAYHFVMEGTMYLSTYLNLISYLKKEIDYIPWHSMMNTLDYMSSFFKFHESEKFKESILYAMSNTLINIGYDESHEDGMRKALRLLLLNWACKYGDHTCRKIASDKLTQQLNYPKQYPMVWKDWIYCAGMMNTNNETWDKVQYNFVYKNDLEKNIHYLACNKNDDMIMELLRTTTFRLGDKWSQLTNVQLRKLYDAIIKKHGKNNNVLDFMLENFNHIVGSYTNKIEALGNIIMNVNSKYQIAKILKHVKKNDDWNKEKNIIRQLLTMRLTEIEKQKDTFVHRLYQYEYTSIRNIR